jgi:hypothetical protein
MAHHNPKPADFTPLMPAQRFDYTTGMNDLEAFLGDNPTERIYRAHSDLLAEPRTLRMGKHVTNYEALLTHPAALSAAESSPMRLMGFASGLTAVMSCVARSLVSVKFTERPEFSENLIALICREPSERWDAIKALGGVGWIGHDTSTPMYHVLKTDQSTEFANGLADGMGVGFSDTDAAWGSYCEDEASRLAAIIIKTEKMPEPKDFL